MPSPRRSTALLLVAAVALAGCSAPFDASAPGSDDARTVSPPGVANGTLANESTLLDAHVAALGERGYRIEIVTGDVRMTTVAESNYSSFRLIPGANSSNPAIWANESTTLARLTRNGETEYQRPPRFWASPRQLTGADALQGLLEAGTYSRTGTTDCGERDCVVLEASNHSRYDSFDAEAHVDGEGVVHRFDATFGREGEDGTVEVEHRLRVTEVGDVTVERPPWVETALDRTS